MKHTEDFNNMETVSSEDFNTEDIRSIARLKISINSDLGRKIANRLERGYVLNHTVLRQIEGLYQMTPYRGKCLDDQYIYGCSGFQYKNATPTELTPNYSWKYVEFEGCTPRFPSNGSMLSNLWDEVVKNRVSFNDLVNEIGLEPSVCRMYEIFYYIEDDAPNDEGRFYLSLSYKDNDLTEKLSLLNNGLKEVPFEEYEKCYNDMPQFGGVYHPLYMREIFFNKSTPKETLERLFNGEDEEG